MAWRPHGHVRVNARSPRAAGKCDRCGFLYNHATLKWQFDWSGVRLQNLRILVCDRCLDVPQQQLRAKILSPDPLPIFNARPEPFTVTGVSYDESNYITTEAPSDSIFSELVGLTITTESTGLSMVTEGNVVYPYIAPPAGDWNNDWN